jgi:hypothetical protein
VVNAPVSEGEHGDGDGDPDPTADLSHPDALTEEPSAEHKQDDKAEPECRLDERDGRKGEGGCLQREPDHTDDGPDQPGASPNEPGEERCPQCRLGRCVPRLERL